jgi:hypothetical protein
VRTLLQNKPQLQASSIIPAGKVNLGFAGMAEQPQLNDVLLGEGVKQMQEISREEILRQIFGDIGELADGEERLWIHPILSQSTR